MGKEKDSKTDPYGGAFMRMNYLYQAAYLVSKTTSNSNSPLSNYYCKVLKEISKKIVEKLHPNLKRSLCVACNNPLTAIRSQIRVKVLSIKNKKKRKILNPNKYKDSYGESQKNMVEKQASKTEENITNYKSNRIQIRNKKPNRIRWTCPKCGLRKVFLQRPNYKTWIYGNEISETLSF